MTLKSYQGVSQRIINILTQNMSERDRKRIPPDKLLTLSNGYTQRISAIFVDIRDSTELFAHKNRDMVTRIVRSFVSETIRIMKNDDSAEIGVRGDCVYGIYSTPDEEKVCQVFEIAYNVNTLMILLNRHYRSKHYPGIKVGIGLATAEDLVVKTAAKGTGISAKVWIGEAVTTASNLSKYGNKEGIKPIVMSDRFYRTLSKRLQRYGLTGHDFSQKTFDGLHAYHCDITNAEVEKWISENVRK